MLLRILIIRNFEKKVVKNSGKIEFFSILEVLENIEKVGRAIEKSQLRQKEYMCVLYFSANT